jgi:hypothetical protein
MKASHLSCALVALLTLLAWAQVQPALKTAASLEVPSCADSRDLEHRSQQKAAGQAGARKAEEGA